MLLLPLSILSFVGGCFSPLFLPKALGRRLDGVDFVRLGFWLLLGVPIILGTSWFVRVKTEMDSLLYLGSFLAGMAFYLPCTLLINLYLLWWDPERYKEYEMKKLRRQRQLDLEKGLKNK